MHGKAGVYEINRQAQILSPAGGGGGIEVYNGKVTGLPDGGFFVAWQQDTTVQGARYTSAGASDGGQFEIGVDLQPDLRSVGLTADGRIAVTCEFCSTRYEFDPADYG